MRCGFDVFIKITQRKVVSAQRTKLVMLMTNSINKRKMIMRKEIKMGEEKVKLRKRERNAEANDDNNFEHSEKILETQSEHDWRKRNSGRWLKTNTIRSACCTRKILS